MPNETNFLHKHSSLKENINLGRSNTETGIEGRWTDRDRTNTLTDRHTHRQKKEIGRKI